MKKVISLRRGSKTNRWREVSRGGKIEEEEEDEDEEQELK